MDFTGCKLLIFPFVILSFFFIYWIIFTPLLWHLGFDISVEEQWPEYWHIAFWFTALLIWLLLAVLVLFFLKRRHQKRLKEKSEQNRKIVTETNSFCQAEFEMKALNHIKPNCAGTEDLNQSDKSKFKTVNMKNYNSVDNNKEIILKPNTKAIRVLGFVSDNDESDSDRKVSASRSYRQPQDNKLLGDINKRKSYSVSTNFKTENEKNSFQKNRNTFYELPSNIPPKPRLIDPSNRIFSRYSLHERSLKAKSHPVFSEKDRFTYNKDIDSGATRVDDSVESNKNLQIENVKKAQEKCSNPKNQDLHNESSNDGNLSQSAFSSKFRKGILSESEDDGLTGSGKDILAEKNKESVPESSLKNQFSESTSSSKSVRQHSSEGSYKGMPQIEKFDTYLKLVQIDTPVSPRNSFFSDLIEAANEQDTNLLPSADSDVFSDAESPTREYFVADVRSRIPSVKTEAFIMIDNTAESNKRTSKRFYLVENSSEN